MYNKKALLYASVFCYGRVKKKMSYLVVPFITSSIVPSSSNFNAARYGCRWVAYENKVLFFPFPTAAAAIHSKTVNDSISFERVSEARSFAVTSENLKWKPTSDIRNIKNKLMISVCEYYVTEPMYSNLKKKQACTLWAHAPSAEIFVMIVTGGPADHI